MVYFDHRFSGYKFKFIITSVTFEFKTELLYLKAYMFKEKYPTG